MCMIDSLDEHCTVWATEDRIAAKPHKCDECARTIAKRETYRRCSWLQEGRWDSSCMCIHCMVAAEWLRLNCGGYVTHGIGADLEEHVEEYAHLALGSRLSR